MYEETKKAVRKAFELAKLLYSIDYNLYIKLYEQALKIPMPTEEEVISMVSEKIPIEKAITIELRNRYKQVAINLGLNEKYGIAFLEYIALHKEMEE